MSREDIKSDYAEVVDRYLEIGKEVKKQNRISVLKKILKVAGAILIVGVIVFMIWLF